MANTYVDYTATAGQTDFAFSFPYLEDEHVEVLIDNVKTTAFSFVTTPSTKVVLNSGATAGQIVRVRRNSDPTVNLVDFVNGSVLTESELDRAYQHNRYLNEEAFEGNTSSLQVLEGTTNFNANFNKIVNLAPPTASLDAANKDYVDDKLALSGTSLSGFNKSTHTGDGTNDQFTLSFTPQTGTASAFRVAIDGVLQTPDDAYTVDSSTSQITFTSAPPVNAEIVVVATGTAQDVNSIGVTATGSTTARSLANRFADVINVKDYGATGDGVTDDTAFLIAATSDVTDGKTLYFPQGTYLISNSGFSDFTSVYGNIVCAFNDVDNISVRGENATIKLVNHDIATYGGLRAFDFQNCNGVNFSGFHFDMTFTGYKDSASFYPFCGAVTAGNASDAAGQNPEDLTENVFVSDCTFKIYHPLGCYGITSNPYSGDSNNGFKIFSVYISGPTSAFNEEEIPNNVTIRDCIIKKGHNAYGFWVWGLSNTVFDNLTAEDFVNKSTSVPAETITSGFSGIPFIRCHQIGTSGVKVTNCYFRAKPSSERTTSGFEGSSAFINYTNSSTYDGSDSARGEYVTSDNVVIMGLGDSANSCFDTGIEISSYGYHVISNNVFDGTDGESVNINPSNPSNLLQSCKAIDITPISRGGNGVLVASIENNLFGRWLKADNITVYNGSDTSNYARRLKCLKVLNNTSYSQAAYFLRIESPGISNTYTGLRHLDVVGNYIDGENSYYDSSSTSSHGLLLQGNQTGDIQNIKNNFFKNKYYGIRDLTSNVTVNTLNNSFDTVTDHYIDAGASSVLTENLGTNEQGSLTAEVVGMSGGSISAKEYSSGDALSLYAQSATNQYLIASKRLNIYAQNAAQVVLDDGVFRPSIDGDVQLGSATLKWGQIYSTSGTINTSDEREKIEIAELSEAELNVARELKGLIRKFKFNKAKNLKGDDARIHVGVIAQDVKNAFDKHGLDGFKYGVLCYDQWDEIKDIDKDGNETVIAAGDAYGVRYSELFAFIIAAL
jgi:hypothetical protein